MVTDDIDDRGSAGPDTFRVCPCGDAACMLIYCHEHKRHCGADVSETAIAGVGIAQETAPSTDWARYRKCSQVCGAAAGKPCVARSGRVVNGRPDGAAVELEVPHGSRRLLRGR